MIKTGKLRALCISVLQRDESLPDVATCDELGYKRFDVATGLGLQSSAGVPPTIVAKLQSVVAKILREHRRAIKDARYPYRDWRAGDDCGPLVVVLNQLKAVGAR